MQQKQVFGKKMQIFSSLLRHLNIFARLINFSGQLGFFAQCGVSDVAIVVVVVAFVVVVVVVFVVVFVVVVVVVFSGIKIFKRFFERENCDSRMNQGVVRTFKTVCISAFHSQLGILNKMTTPCSETMATV